MPYDRLQVCFAWISFTLEGKCWCWYLFICRESHTSEIISEWECNSWFKLCPGFHVPGQWVQGEVWIEHQWTFIIRWCHFQESWFPTIIYNKPKDIGTNGGEISDVQTMYTQMWVFKRGKKKKVFEDKMKRIENFFPYGTWEIWKKTKLKISFQNVILFFQFLSLIFENLENI